MPQKKNMPFFNTKLYCILTETCPKCHSTKLFSSGAFNFSNPLQMHEKCSKCEQVFELEPGFYWGAMYMAYGLSSALLLTTFVVCNVYFGLNITQSYFIMIGLLIVFFTMIFRFARAIWINMFVSFDKKKYGK